MKIRLLLLLILGGCLPAVVMAHPAEQGFVLLLPTDIYSLAGTAAVMASLIVVSLLPPAAGRAMFRPVVLCAVPSLERLQTITSLCATGVFFGLLFIGVTGPNDPLSNIWPLIFWTVIWVGLVVAQAVFGDIWAWVSPWTGMGRLLAPQVPPFRLPDILGCWPAVCLLVAFNGFAIADLAPSDPTRLAQFAMVYWAFTFLGMMMFGARDWLSRVEVFTVFFRLLSRLSPVRWRGHLQLGWPGWRALEAQNTDLSRAIFCIALLGSGSFDGLHETFWWLSMIDINPLAFPGRSAVVWPSTLGLIAGNIVLVAVFALAVWVGVKLVNWLFAPQQTVAFRPCFVAFAISLLPIAVGYHFAHFLTSFLVQIQYAVIALTDPLARGADWLRLGQLQVTTGFLNTQDTVRQIWLTQAGAVVLSHILSVLMAHHIAGRLVQGRAAAILLQVGLGVLMIAYTIFGLWLLATPRGA